jgi:hypothetical protein
MITRGLQALAAVLLVVAGGVFVWWRTRPPPGMALPVALAPPPAAAPVAPVAAAPGVPQPVAPGAVPGAVPGTAVAPGTAPAAVPGALPPGTVAVAPGAAPPIVPGLGPARPKPIAKPGDAHITVASDPRCEVLVDGVPFGATPLIDLAVPAGKHVVILLNSQAGIKEVQKVTLTTGQLWTRSFQWDGGKMSAQNGLSAKMLAGAPAAAAPAPAPAAVAAAEPKKDPVPTTHPKPVEGPASAPPAPVAAPAPKPAPPPTPPPTVKPAVPAAPPARMVAGFVLDAQKVSASAAHLPDAVTDRERGKKLVGTYKICVNKEGHVYDVTTVASISGADGSIMETIRGWKYKPQTGNVCASKVLTFQVP